MRESDLLIDLYRGADPVAPWRDFLARMAGRGDAMIVVLPPDGEAHIAATDGARQFPIQVLQRLRFDRVYSAEELGGASPYHMARVMRVRGDAWLILGREGADYAAATSALMSSFAPHLAQAAADYLRRCREAQDRALSDHLSNQIQAGWLVLNAAGIVLSASDTALRLLVMNGISGQIGGRLALGKTLANTLQDYDHGFHQDPVALNIPPLQVLIQPYAGPDPMQHRPAAQVYLRLSTPRPIHAERTLSEMAHISPSEARFALALAGGLTIAQAGESLGLTLETARNYSKMIYSKMELRGQADLIRWIENSVLRLV